MKKGLITWLAVMLMAGANVFAQTLNFCEDEPTQTDLLTDTGCDAGDIILGSLDGILYVTVITDGGWTLLQTRIAVGDSIADIPLNACGCPATEAFPYASLQNKQTMYVEAIPLNSFPHDSNIVVMVNSLVDWDHCANGGPAPVCAQPCDDPVEECSPCDGKVTQLELLYTGADDGVITVMQKDGAVVFGPTLVASMETISFTGTDKKGTLGTEISIYVDSVLNTKIHTSCSQPIGPGLVKGDFEVLSGESRNGGPLCPPGVVDDDDSSDDKSCDDRSRDDDSRDSKCRDSKYSKSGKSCDHDSRDAKSCVSKDSKSSKSWERDSKYAKSGKSCDDDSRDAKKRDSKYAKSGKSCDHDSRDSKKCSVKCAPHGKSCDHDSRDDDSRDSRCGDDDDPIDPPTDCIPCVPVSTIISAWGDGVKFDCGACVYYIEHELGECPSTLPDA